MRNERKRYTEEFKREAVRLMESSEKLIAEIARDLGINDNNLYRWRGQYGPQSVGKAMGSNRNIGEMEAEEAVAAGSGGAASRAGCAKKAMHIFSRSPV